MQYRVTCIFVDLIVFLIEGCATTPKTEKQVAAPDVNSGCELTAAELQTVKAQAGIPLLRVVRPLAAGFAGLRIRTPLASVYLLLQYRQFAFVMASLSRCDEQQPDGDKRA
jgi:hypothetical protein